MPTLQELDTEVALLAEKLQVTKAFADAMRAYEATVGRKIAGSSTGNVTVRHRRRSDGPLSATEQVASELMERTGNPVPTAVVIAEMQALGHHLPNKAPNVISARLSNSARFKARRGFGYWFADRPWPGEEGSQPPLGFGDDKPEGEKA